MKQILTPLTAIAFFTFVLPLYADYGVTDHGTWPDSWPKELEPFRRQSRTFEGPKQPLLAHAIPFTARADFESAWPHILMVKSKGAPIVTTPWSKFLAGREEPWRLHPHSA